MLLLPLYLFQAQEAAEPVLRFDPWLMLCLQILVPLLIVYVIVCLVAQIKALLTPSTPEIAPRNQAENAVHHAELEQRLARLEASNRESFARIMARLESEKASAKPSPNEPGSSNAAAGKPVPAPPKHKLEESEELAEEQEILGDVVAAQDEDDDGDGDHFKEATRLLRHMEEDHPYHLLEARRLFTKELNGPMAAAAHISLAETLFWLGDISEDRNEKENFHGEGVQIGKKAVSLAGQDVAAHLWYAANMGSHGVARGIMSSLFYLGDIEKHGKRAMELDRAFFHGAPLRLMGRFYHQCPGWPIGKGDLGKAIDLLEQAVDAGPDFLLNHLYLAEVYMAKRKKRQARELLEKVLAVNTFALMPQYQRNVQNQAKELMTKL
jgi:tetratricopeptide (TPR) repeat protein